MELLQNNKQTISSREIAELTGKEHKNVLADCDKLNENYKVMGLAEISADQYTDQWNRKQRHYLLTKLQTFDLMTGYSVELRIKVNRRWAELEAKELNQIPQSFSEALKLAYEQSLKIEEQQKQLEAQAPKVLFTEAVMGSSSSCLIGELAKIITQNGYQIGEKRLFKWLRENHYLGIKGERYNIPNQQYIEQGLFELKKGTRSGNNGVMHTTITTKVTGKGQVYFVNKFLSSKIAIAV